VVVSMAVTRGGRASFVLQQAHQLGVKLQQHQLGVKL